MPVPLVARRRPWLATALLGALACAGSSVHASDAPAGHAEEAVPKKPAPPVVVVAPPPSPASQDPMTRLRQKLAAKLGAAPGKDAETPNVLSVSLKSAPGPAHDVDPPRAAPIRARAMAPKAVATTCTSGTRQSPIDIQGGIRVDLDPVQFDYKPSAFRVLDNGHTVQVNVGPGSSIEVGGRRFELVRFEFHRPSEERIDGKQFDMGVHLVHQDADGRLAIVALLLERGSAHPVVQSVWNNLPLEKGEEQAARAPLPLADLLPVDRSYFTYMGSLTAPPCSEGVLWMVMKTPVPISSSQIDVFAHLYPMNARPIQASAGRLIKESN